MTLVARRKVPAGLYVATELPEIDFETFSCAGYVWNDAEQKWDAPPNTPKSTGPGLGAVGAAFYAGHPSTEVLCFSYDLKDGYGVTRWVAGDPFPQRLYTYLGRFDPTAPPSYDQDGIIEAHNAMFEVRIFLQVLHERYGWPAVDVAQFRCSMAKAVADCRPPSLEKLGEVLGVDATKDKDGKRLIKLFCMPQKPSAKQPALRVWPQLHSDGPLLYGYCDQDVRTEAACSIKLPDLRPIDLAFFLVHQECNWKGLQVDVETAEAAADILRQAFAQYDPEIAYWTGGAVSRASEVSKLQEWVTQQTGVAFKKLDDDAIEAALLRPEFAAPEQAGMINPARRVLEIRAMTSSASVKKVLAMARMATPQGRVHDIHRFNGARTGRDAHNDLQPGNLPKDGPNIRWCDDAECQRPYAYASGHCPWCGASAAFSSEKAPGTDEKGWHWKAVPYAIQVIRSGRLDYLQAYFGDAFLTITGCIRGMIIAAPGHKLICSDYSSIEAVVTAVLSGEEWRVEAFRRREDIYLHGAAGVTGKTYEWYVQWAKENGKKHPDRQKIGKPAELGMGFGGWIGAWRQFDKTDTFTDDEVKRNIVAWRDASPMIVELWGGQVRGKPWKPTSYELYGLEGMAVKALLEPGTVQSYRGIKYQVLNGTLYCTLLSGRTIPYHGAFLTKVQKFQGVETYSIRFWGWNTNQKKGALGWIVMETYGGQLAENVIQATANDILRFACVNLQAAGYPVVMRVHDEIVGEIVQPAPGTEKARIDEFERIMGTLPEWAVGWPIRAAGGYLADRYRKD